MPSSRLRYSVSTRSHPPTSAPQARARNAYDESPAPPMPTNQRRLPASGRKRDQLLRDLVGRLRSRHRAHGRAHRLEPRRVGEQLRRRERGRGRAPPRARPRRRRPARSAARSASGDRRWRAGTGRGSRGCPTRRAPTRCRLPARSRDREQRGRRRTRRSTRRGRSRPCAPGRAGARSRARPRCAAPPGLSSPYVSTAKSLRLRAPASAPKNAITGAFHGRSNGGGPLPSRRRDGRRAPAGR